MASPSYNVASFEFNSTTYNATTGGTIRLQYSARGEPLEDWTGTDEWNTFCAIVNKRLRVRLTLREVKCTVALGTTDTSCAGTLTVKGGTSVITFVNLHLFAVEGDAGRAEVGTCVLEFAHQSADGTATPYS